MDDELKKSSGYLIRPGDGSEPAAHVTSAWGADIPGDAGAASRQGQYPAMMVRWYTPAEALKIATVDNGELMALSGYINPYSGKLSVVEVGHLRIYCSSMAIRSRTSMSQIAARTLSSS
jgi:hypothetical protein